MSEQFDKDEKRQKWLLKELEFWEKKYKYEENQKFKDNKKRIKDRIELYQKYLKNKDIETQIIELEQKLNKLKSEII